MAIDAGAARGRPRPVVLITGASAGLGSELARELVRQKKAGALVLTARRGDRLDELARELKQAEPGLQILTIAADLADPGDARTPGRGDDAPIRGARRVWSTTPAWACRPCSLDAEPEQLTRQLAVNLTAPLLLTRLSLPSLIERKGMIINIGSAITCVANSALGAYGATKAGLAYWNDALRRELATKG